MKNGILVIVMICIFATSAFADIPNTLNYQGRLMDQSGQPVLDGQYVVTFRLYTAASGGNMVWEEQQTVATQNGYFNTVLGNTTALTPAMFSRLTRRLEAQHLHSRDHVLQRQGQRVVRQIQDPVSGVHNPELA